MPPVITLVSETSKKLLDGMYLSTEKAELILKMLLDGMSVSAEGMAHYARNVKVGDIEMDETRSFIGKREKRVRLKDDQNPGDCYTSVDCRIHKSLRVTPAMAAGISDQVLNVAGLLQ